MNRRAIVTAAVTLGVLFFLVLIGVYAWAEHRAQVEAREMGRDAQQQAERQYARTHPDAGSP